MRRTVAAVLLLGLVAGCGGNAPTEQAGGQWSFKDDRGKEVTAEKRPERVVAQVSAAGALKDYGINVVGTFGPLKRADGSTDPEAGSIDPSQVTDVTGPGYGEIDFEKFAALNADLVVAGYYPEVTGLWHLTAEFEEKVTKVAPTVGIGQSKIQLPDGIKRFKDLAKSLGADVDSAKVKADEEAFTKAADRLKAIGRKMTDAKQKIQVIGADPKLFYVAVPARNPDLDWYVKELGLPLLTPEKPDTEGGGYFQSLSWENSGTYKEHVIMWDTRQHVLNPEQMKEGHPVFQGLPAVQAGRFVEWNAVAPLSYSSYAGIMNKLADQLDQVLAK
ncbi:ABC transporter substrate-binding protein [Lentzea sp. NBRC 102530]|uniref:ABC transporter substrate-binding protein n=1 Tax=Lentzea sp. NBRC 102530 TaxID=3032201 RepID=UPI0024A24FEF|nr:ABC transporter substrate-binding protein [Lentzea sp. NBRC 102530]GLY46654.1 ABC transporter substrate-binding protein [Lentzea sp. NBRC 102530]